MKEQKSCAETFENAFLRKNPTRPQVLRTMRGTIGKGEVGWEDLTKKNLIRIADAIKSAVSPNSAVTYLATIKAVLGEYTDEGVLPCQRYQAALATRRVPSQHVALTEAEIERIHKYTPRSGTERDVKAAFLIECYCGARSCDVQEKSSWNITGDTLTYVSKKTQVETTVPLHKNIRAYLKYTPAKTHTRAVFNNTIRRICRNVGICDNVKIYYHGRVQERPKYEFVGSHTARRSFATNLALRHVAMPTISALMNHNRNEAMTARYVCADTRNLEANAMAFFGA